MPEQVDQRQANVKAFLDAIATFESAVGDAGYVMLYGGGEFEDFRDHPGNLGWGGVRLPDELCAKAGLGAGCVSTAAGRYQITRTTWNRLRRSHGDTLPDFSPASQDTAATILLGEEGALQPLEAGDFDEALVRARRIWASMPAAGYGQREHSVDKWREAYTDAGGTVANV